MFRLDMRAIRENAKDLLLTANRANPANHGLGFFGKLAELAELAVSNCARLQIAPADSRLWRELDRAYLGHHFNCPTCVAGGQARGLRCSVGASLWTAYSAVNPSYESDRS
jgi:hypothetical protein